MRDRGERFVFLRFTIGCASEASVAVGKSSDHQVKKQSEEPKATRRQEKEEGSLLSADKKKNGFISFLGLPKPNISGGIERLIRSIKSISQIFVYKEDESKEIETEMEIGFPTDVKHVTHIGLDGSRTINRVKGWENLNPPEVISFPSISLKQFELAMTAQSHHIPLAVDDLDNVVKENMKA